MKFLLISALIVATANACAPPVSLKRFKISESMTSFFSFIQQPGVTWTTTTVTTTTASGSGSAAGGLVGDSERGLISSTWEMARKNGNVAPKTLFR